MLFLAGTGDFSGAFSGSFSIGFPCDFSIDFGGVFSTGFSGALGGNSVRDSSEGRNSSGPITVGRLKYQDILARMNLRVDCCPPGCLFLAGFLLFAGIEASIIIGLHSNDDELLTFCRLALVLTAERQQLLVLTGKKMSVVDDFLFTFCTVEVTTKK